MNTAPLIQIQNLCKSFHGRVILQDANLDIHRNQITAIIGKSGVGKSVLVKHIIGLIDADSGDIIFDGQSYSRMDRKAFSAIKNRCSYMFQHNALFDSMTVFENIALPLQEKFALKKAAVTDKVNARIAQLELTEVTHMYPKQISGGMQKRVALARALITEPEIIFFDEPTTGLDPIRKKTVFSMIHRYHEQLNFTAVIITHDIPDIFYIAHTVHILDNGRIVFSGTPVDLEQSGDPELYSYTHGHEMLVDELTGLHNRVALNQKLDALLGTLHNGEQLALTTVRIAGLRMVMDFKGNLLAHALIKNIAKCLRGLMDKIGCAGTFSHEVLVAAVRTTDPSVLDTHATALTRFFNSEAIQEFCGENRLHVEIGGILATAGTTATSAIQNALATSKKCI